MLENKIGVCIPTLNRNTLLCELLETIPSNIKVFVSDNGGYITDEMKMKYNNMTIHTFNEQVEMFENWNKAIELADTDFVVIPSDDDLYNDDAFKIIIDEITKNNDIDIFIYGHNNIDENGSIISSWRPSSNIVFDPPYGFQEVIYGVEARMPSVIIKKELMEEIGILDTKLKLTAADSDFIQRALLKGRAMFIPKIISNYRVWAGNLTSQKQATKQWIDEIEYWTSKISSQFLVDLDKEAFKINARKYRDEILARNILAGAKGLYKKGEMKEVVKFVKSQRSIKFANTTTKLRIILLLLKARLN